MSLQEKKPGLAGGAILIAILGGLLVSLGYLLPSKSPESPAAAAPGASLDRVVEIEGSQQLSEEAVEGRHLVPGAASTVPGERIVSGFVLDQTDDPVSGAYVYIVGRRNPFGRVPCEERLGNFVGLGFTTDAAGRFKATGVQGDSVLVSVQPRGLRSPYRVGDRRENERWVTPPEDDVLLRVVRRPPSVLSVSVVDAKRHDTVADYRLVMEGKPIGYLSVFVEDGLFATPPFVVADPDGETVTVKVSRTGSAEAVERVRVFPGVDQHVVLSIGIPEGCSSGQVVDPHGKPIPGARVILGNAELVRGANPMGSIEWRSVPHATTDADGWFLIAGEGTEVSAIHDQYSPCTVVRKKTVRLSLKPCGSISIYGLRDRIRPSLLSEANRLPIASGGGYHFQDVPAGFHCVRIGGNGFVGVLVESGETCTVDLSRRIRSVQIILLRGGDTCEETEEGILVGDGHVGSFAQLSFVEGRAQLANVVPGSYILFLRSGEAVPILVERGLVHAELGEATLAVQGSPGERFGILPASKDKPFLRGLSQRLKLAIPSEGQLLIRVHEGEFVVFPHGLDGGSSRVILVNGMEATLSLPTEWSDGGI